MTLHPSLAARLDELTYKDTFSYRHNIAGGGNAVLTIKGVFKLN